MSDSLFPLRLTLWEELFVVDDYENYPANFMTRIVTLGRLEQKLFLKALANCISSHPFFDCRIRQQGRKLFWEKAGYSELPVEFSASKEEPGIPKLRKFDVFSQRLWRIRYVEWNEDNGQPRTSIFVELHHAICDGLGAIQFISDVAKEIHDLSQNLSGEPSTGNPTRVAGTDLVALKNRGKFPQTWKEFFRGLPYHYKSLTASLRLIFTKVAPLVPVDSVNGLMEKEKETLGYLKISLSSTESSKLRRACRKQNTTVNSRVAAEIFRTIADWKTDLQHPPWKALRIVMPFNERNLKDARLPACNRVSLSPFTRKANEISNPDKLLSSIENGVRLVKKGRLGINFHRGLWFCKTFFGSLKKLAKTDRVGTTCMFANVGNLHTHLGLPVADQGVRCGPFTIVDLDLVPPIRVGTSFAMTMHEFNGQTRLGVHYDSSMMGSDEANSFFGLLKKRILAIAT